MFPSLKLSAALEALELHLSVTVKQSTIIFYRAGIRVLLDFTGDVAVDVISRQTLLHWHNHLKAEGYAPKTISGYSKGVKRLFSWLVEEGLLEESPAGVLKIRERQTQTPKAITEADYQALLGAARLDPRLHLFILLLADTGARVAEIASITLEAIAFDHRQQRGKIWVEGKGDKGRFVLFGSVVYRELNAYLMYRKETNHPYLFASRATDTHMRPNSLRYALYQAAERAGVRGRVNPHSFRHRFARIFLQRGGDMASLSRLLGHSSVTITLKYYVHWTEAELDHLHASINPSKIDIDQK